MYNNCTTKGAKYGKRRLRVQNLGGGAPYLSSGRGFSRFKNGFTLAEVLITLGIIGVVAALTMPSLIADYKKKVYVVQLQKAVSVWDNAMKLMLAADEVEYLNDTELVKILRDAGRTDYQVYADLRDSFPQAEEILKKYLKINFINPPKQYNYTFLGGSLTTNTYYNAIMPDGTIYTIILYSITAAPSDSLQNGSVNIDVNGPKGPNIMGRDLFLFAMDSRGNLVPSGAGKFGNDWKTSSYLCGTPGSSVISSSVTGQGCAARIMEEGWVMNY